MSGTGTQYFLRDEICHFSTTPSLRGDLIDVDRATCSNTRVGEQDTVKSELIARRREKKNKTSTNVGPTLCFALLLHTRNPQPSRL